jgi:ferritin-like metal-binding protein YciE
MMATSLQELFVEELRDIYDGEKRLLRALPKMARAAGSPQLQSAFTMHARETERQVTRLEQVFRALGQPVRGKKCDGIMGIVEEANAHIQELDGALLDAALLAGAQKVEHYEIATYGTLAYFAEILGQDRAKDLLGTTLEEEKATDEKLTALAKSDVNRKALMGLDAGGDDAGRGGMMSGMRQALGLGGGSTGRSSRRSSAGGRASSSRGGSRSASSRGSRGSSARRATRRGTSKKTSSTRKRARR